MADIVDTATRSRMMRGIRGTNTRPELSIRRLLHAGGFRFRLHGRLLPGKPDIVLRRHNAVILVHGCFWHGHDCPLFRMPRTRTEFWAAKIGRNRANDVRAIESLRKLGWRVAVIWECALKGRGSLEPEHLSGRIIRWLQTGSRSLVVKGKTIRDR
jgi:DNA mismatch endonuclease (patch repair protein)